MTVRAQKLDGTQSDVKELENRDFEIVVFFLD